uniref:Serine-threonine/tyrosine-protein kinase catalytic domain-containing protein n=1 Tax=Oryza glumipatula TaxID=40148 RepID=A0A0D9YT38_9ORYZ
MATSMPEPDAVRTAFVKSTGGPARCCPVPRAPAADADGSTQSESSREASPTTGAEEHEQRKRRGQGEREVEDEEVHVKKKTYNKRITCRHSSRLARMKGISRLYDRGTDPHTTHVVSTIGYLAPELGHTGRPSKASDIFAFGVFMLEVTCGRRPVSQDTNTAVTSCWWTWCWSIGGKGRSLTLWTHGCKATLPWKKQACGSTTTLMVE